MILGNQTVNFVTVVEDPNSRDRYRNPALVRTEIPVRGCRFRPMTAAERIELGDIVTDPYRCTAPPVPAVMNAAPGDEVKVAGVTYQIVGGVRVFPGITGLPFKCTIVCERRPG